MLLILLLCVTILNKLQGQENPDILERTISISISNKPIKSILNEIALRNSISFSYNPDVLPVDSLVSISASYTPLKFILSAILPRYEFKVLSNTIIITPKDKVVPKSSRKNKYVIRGVVYDRISGKTIASASVYEAEKLNSALSDSEGQYELQFNSREEEVRLVYSKKNYWDTIIYISPEKSEEIEISLRPKPSKVNQMPARDFKVQQNKKRVFDVAFAKTVISDEMEKYSENLYDITEERPAQVSFLPNLGANRKLSGIVDNKFSFNVLAGYAHGVTGLEIGGLLNVVRENVDGVQISGFGNVVGSEVNGVQVAGFFNHGVGEVNGLQVAGFANVVQDTIKGVQISGFSNVVKGKMNGVQIAGFSNYVTSSIDGVQISGFMNVAQDSAGEYQIAGFGNFGKHLNGVQISGFGNLNIDDGKGVQIAGALNINTGNFTGTQVSGLLNYAKKVKGSQVGVFNFCDSLDGAAVGILSFVKKGYHELEIFNNELTYANLSFKTGTRKFYNIITAGLGRKNDKNFWLYGYGFGRSQKLKEDQWYMDIDLVVSVLNMDKGFNDYFSLQNKLALGLSKKIRGPLYLFAGISTSFYIYEPEQQNTDLIIKGNKMVEGADHRYNLTNWMGYQMGVRI